MILLPLLLTAVITAAILYCLFILLFMVRRVANRLLWSRVMRFIRPILREFYAYDLAEAANKVMQAQPDEIHLISAAGRRASARAEELAASLRELGFSEAGVFSIDVLPGIFVRFLIKEDDAAGACVYEHPAAGAWIDICSERIDGGSIAFSTLPDPGLPGQMRRPDSRMEYRPGDSAKTLYERFLFSRGPNAAAPLSAAGMPAVFERAWAREMEWRKEHEFSPSEALAIKKGRAIPGPEVRNRRLFDAIAAALAIANVAALLAVLFLSRPYPALAGGPWREALLHTLLPLAVFIPAFMYSVQTDGPVSRLFAGVFMTLIAFPFFWGTVYYGEIYLNGALDKGAASTRRAAVIEKRSDKHGESHSALLASWRTGRKGERVSVSEEDYARIRPGRTLAAVTTRPGALGHEWIADIVFEEPASSH